MYERLKIAAWALLLSGLLVSWVGAQPSQVPQLTTDEKLAQCLGEIGSLGRSYGASQQATQVAAGEMAVQLQRVQAQLQQAQKALDEERVKHPIADDVKK